MPRQIHGQWPATERRYVPETHGDEGYREKAHVISMVRVLERGPDVELHLHVRGIPSGRVQIPARDEVPVLERLFREPPALDREVIGQLADELVDITLRAAADESGQLTVKVREYEPVMLAKRRICALVETLAADLAAITGLPADRQGAA